MLFRSPSVRLVVHATADAYTEATGLPWYTSGAAAGGSVHLLPLAYLQDRGLLERTVRRALVRVLVDTALGDRPEWVRVGASVYYAEPDGAPPAQPSRPSFFRLEPRPSCPDDRELRQPASPGELNAALGRARSCFSRQVASGRSWRDVR